VGRASFDFNDAESLALPCDQVKVAFDAIRRPSAGHHCVAVAHEIKEANFLTLQTGGKMLWLGRPPASMASQ
jgi:hypothetical protein